MPGNGKQTVIFDVDGTLVDSTYHHAMAWLRAFRTHGIEVPAWQVHRAIGMGGDRLVEALAGAVVERQLGDRLRASWSESYHQVSHEVTALPGARACIEALHESGHPVCVASSGSRDDTFDALDIVGIRALVDEVATGDDVDASKPAPDTLEHVWRASRRGAAVVVGDSTYDVEAAGRLGLPCVAVRTGGIGADELSKAGAALVVDDLQSPAGAPWVDLAHVSRS